jgi:hypothetical protein
MNTQNDLRFQSMPPAHVLEAAQMILPQLLDIDDPAEAAERVAALAELPTAQADALARMARNAGDESRDEIVTVLQMVLAELAVGTGPQAAAIQQKIDAVGRKQLVIGPEYFYMGALLIAGWIAYKGGGRAQQKRAITLETTKDGRTKLTVNEETTYLNPLNPLVGLISRIWKQG